MTRRIAVCVIAFSFLVSSLLPNARRPSSARFSEPSAFRISSPKVCASRWSVDVPGCTTSFAISSKSTTGTLCSRNSRDTVDLPEAIPPDNPTTGQRTDTYRSWCGERIDLHLFFTMGDQLQVDPACQCPVRPVDGYVSRGDRKPYLSHLLQPSASPQHLLAVSDVPALLLFDKARLAQPMRTIPVPANENITGVANVEYASAAWAGSSQAGYIALWDARSQSADAVRLAGPSGAPYLSVAANGPHIAAGTELVGADAAIDLWDMRNPQAPVCTYGDVHSDDIMTLTFHPDAAAHPNILLSGGMDGLVSAIDTTIAQEEDAVISVGNTDSSLARVGFATHAPSYRYAPKTPPTDVDLDEKDLALSTDPRRTALGPVYAVSNMQTLGVWDADKFDCIVSDVAVRTPTSFRPPWATDYVVDAGGALPTPIVADASTVRIPMMVGDQEGGAALISVDVDASDASAQWTLHARLPCAQTSSQAHSDIVRSVAWDANVRPPTHPDAAPLYRWRRRQAPRVDARRKHAPGAAPAGARRRRRAGVHAARSAQAPDARGNAEAPLHAVFIATWFNPAPMLSLLRRFRPQTMSYPVAEPGALQQLGPLLYVRHPVSQAPPQPHTPSAVVVCGWMDAQLKHVDKYAKPYSEMYPHATVLIQLSTAKSAFFTTREGSRPEAETSLEVLRSASDRARNMVPGERPTVLFHSFSNGGFIPLSTLLYFGCKDPMRLPQPLAHIMECSPGELSGKTLADAMTVGADTDTMYGRTSEWMTRTLGRALMDGISGYSQVRGQEHPFERVKREFNEPASWAWSDAPARIPPRLYTMTLADQFIPPDRVYKHAAQANAALTGQAGDVPVVDMEGLAPEDVRLNHVPVQICRWEHAKHCELARHAGPTYWTAIRQFLTSVVATRVAPQSKL